MELNIFKCKDLVDYNYKARNGQLPVGTRGSFMMAGQYNLRHKQLLKFIVSNLGG